MIKSEAQYTLIADAGSSKTDWVLTDASHIINQFQTPGLNILLASDGDIYNAFSEVKNKISSFIPSRIFYYGAGCATSEICNKTKATLNNNFHVDHIEVASDLLGAARGLFLTQNGIICILGTGSNSGLYDGKEIVKNVPSLGFILGDEGGGAALGKRLINEIFKGSIPQYIKLKFQEETGYSLADVLEKVYKSSSPNKFLASLVPFIKENIWNPYIYGIVLKEFKAFVRRNILRYSGAHAINIGVIGSIGVEFEKILHEAASTYGITINRVVKSPIEGLITYHANF